jgi:hypothetical protein
VAVIPMMTPEEAIEELDYAVQQLGFKTALLASFVRRPVASVEKLGGLDLLYDYDPLWDRCLSLGISPAAHSGAVGWDGHRSPSKYNNPANFDRRVWNELFERHGAKLAAMASSGPDIQELAFGSNDRSAPTVDEFAACGLETEADIPKRFDRKQFRAFTFENAARFYTDSNPKFFEGTALESDVAKLLAKPA